MMHARHAKRCKVALAVCSATLATSALAQKTPPARPAIADEIAGCRAVASEAARLACYDRTAAKLSAMLAANEVVVFDREEIKATRRGLFGFSLPRLPFFKRGEREAGTVEELTELTAKVATARDNGYGRYTVKLEDGAVWRTTEAVVRPPRSGSEVTIRRAALGSYFLRVGNARGVRAMRVN